MPTAKNALMLPVRAAVTLPMLLAAGLAAAQTPTQGLRDIESQIEEAGPRPGPARVEVPRASIVAPQGADGITLDIVEIALVGRDGAPVADDRRLPLDPIRARLAAQAGQRMTLAQVYATAREIEVGLKADGFVFTRVLVPRQELDQAAARVQIVLLGVSVEKVVIEEPADAVGPVSELIAKLAAPLEGLSNPRIQDLERASLLATDLPGITRATFVPGPGSTPDTIVLSLNVERDVWNAVGLVTHHDSPVIGPGVIGGIGYLNSYTSFAASTELAYFNSWSFDGFPDFDERNTVQLTQRGFLDWGTELWASALYSHTKPGDFLEPLDLSGDQYEFRLGAEHPVLRSRDLSLWVNGGFDWIDSTVDFSGNVATLTDDSLRVIHLGARAGMADAWGATSADITLRKGLDILGASEEGDTNLSRFDGTGDFFLLRGEIAREQPIWREVSGHVRIAGQWSPDTVLANEGFALGGARYLKAYDPSEALGDSGFAAYGELRYTDQVTFRGVDFGYEFYGFADYGIVFQTDLPGDNSTDLASSGGGVRFQLPAGPRFEIEMAVPLAEPLLRTGERDLRVFGSLVWFL
ncbi:hypothetical protein M1105_10025 [Limibaculum sp. FT325]|uniref:ShlB/FhaC/HecB family hemolysin secretion/activation protein n=1 Tax=Thermohalobaculum sediminis TaxID=2939436 RepID=UPI0020C13D52|nr:ShlB/FhaC/HecB family hemolysin secretion/activation protein [Limibaculum sediminis]MCL5777323.1 hypothetical protein [Limibaculum sediminis]